MSRRLLIRPGAIGDFLVSLPTLEHLRAGYTEVWTAAQNVPLALFADRARAIASTGLDVLGIPDVEPPEAVWRELERFDSIVSWYGANRPEFREAVSRLPVRFYPALPPQDTHIHAADYYLQQAGGPLPAVPRLSVPRSRGGFAAIHPFSGSARKNWPLERFREIAQRLESRMPVRWCAGPEETLEGAVRFGNLYDLACWLASADLYIGNDSGISHLAAAVGTPVVAVFQASDPRIWAPRGPRVRVAQGGVEDVWQAVCEI